MYFWPRSFIQWKTYQADVKEHSLLGHDDGDFALNFNVPFLLQCGFPATKAVLKRHLDQPLHPAEHSYLHNYFHRYLDGPKPLAVSCRGV